MERKLSQQEIQEVKKKVRKLLPSYPVAAYYDSCGYQQQVCCRYELLVGLGSKRTIALNPEDDPFSLLASTENEWLFGYLGYDAKNHVEKLSSLHPSSLSLPESFFFIPEHVICIEGDVLRILSDTPEALLTCIFQAKIGDESTMPFDFSLQPSITKEEYLKTIHELKRHIAEGDIYEVTYCFECSGKREINPYALFDRLLETSPVPMSAFLSIEGKYILSLSPERYLWKENDVLISQPIKGTIARKADKEEDALQVEKLRNSEKERAENVMIVDLVRNDLARVSQPGTVKVNELFGIYTFPTVHQMISTISGQLREGKDGIAALRASFPMGSMTGAPKIRAMQLIERYENFRRGVYSGAIGYMKPGGDFDWNVCIRTFIYDADAGNLIYPVGSAITFDADPEAEWEECMLKVDSMRAKIKAFS